LRKALKLPPGTSFAGDLPGAAAGAMPLALAPTRGIWTKNPLLVMRIGEANLAFRPDLKQIEASYDRLLKDWDKIDDSLDLKKVGRKDQPFDKALMENMLLAWDYIDYFIKKKDYNLLSIEGGPDMLEVNHRVHYGVNSPLRHEYKKAIDATTEKFSRQVVPIRDYYRKKKKLGVSTYHVAAEIFIAIVGMPQLYIEGNHRSGSIIASWVNLVNEKPPFVLTAENAVAFFEPAQEIKKFDKKSLWRSMTKLPKYKKEFKTFWKTHCDMSFAKK
jgi:hypothetical protein